MASMLAESPSDLFIESSDSSVASAAASIASGWNEPVPGRELHPLKTSAFHCALSRQLTGIVSAMPYNGAHRWPSPLAQDSDRTRFNRHSAQAASAKSARLAAHGQIACPALDISAFQRAGCPVAGWCGRLPWQGDKSVAARGDLRCSTQPVVCENTAHRVTRPRGRRT